MKAISAFFLLILLASCAQQQPSASGKSPQGILAFTDADLTNAIALAQAAAPTDPSAQMIATCFTFIKSQLASLQAPATSSGTVGLATAFTVADLALSNAATAISVTSQAQYATACGPLVIFTKNQGLAITTQIALLGALIAH